MKLTEKGISGDLWILNPEAWGIREIAFINKHDGDKWLITGHDEGAVYLWDLENLETRKPGFELDFKPSYLLRGHKKVLGEGAIRAMAISPDGRWLVTGSNDRTALLWSLSTLKASTLSQTIEVKSSQVLHEYLLTVLTAVIGP